MLINLFWLETLSLSGPLSLARPQVPPVTNAAASRSLLVVAESPETLQRRRRYTTLGGRRRRWGGGVPQISNLNRRLRRSLRSGGWRSQLNPWFCARRSVWGLYGPCAVCSQLLPRISAPPTKNKKKLRAARNRPDLQHDRFSINSLNPHRLNPHQAAADNPGCSIVLPVLEPRFWGWTDRDCDKPE